MRLQFEGVKNYGDPQNEIVIVLHGFLDNAGSFDRLMPKMPETFYYVCMELPGHGLSTNFDASLPLHYINYLLALRVVTDHFKRKSYILIGHSFGATLSVIYSQLYPKLVSKLIMLDSLYVIPVDVYSFMSNLQTAYDIYFDAWTMETKEKTYSYEEVIQRVKSYRYPDLEDDGPAEDIARRMIKRTEDEKYSFTTDPQLKALILPCFTVEYTRVLFETRPVFCPKLILLTKGNKYNELNGKLLDYLKEKEYDIREIQASHHVHQLDPEVVLKHIVPFLLNQRAKF